MYISMHMYNRMKWGDPPFTYIPLDDLRAQQTATTQCEHLGTRLAMFTASFNVAVLLTVPSMRRKGRPTVVCHVCGDFSMRLLMVSRISTSSNVCKRGRVSEYTHAQRRGDKNRRSISILFTGVGTLVRVGEVVGGGCEHTTPAQNGLVRTCEPDTRSQRLSEHGFMAARTVVLRVRPELLGGDGLAEVEGEGLEDVLLAVRKGRGLRCHVRGRHILFVVREERSSVRSRGADTETG